MNAPRLMLGDCLERMAEVEDGSVDLILADLPYGTTACKWDTVIPFGPLWAHYRRIIKPPGAIVLTASQPFTSKLVMSNPAWFRYEWVWNKIAASNFQQSRFQPLKCHESILIFGPSPAVFTRSGKSMNYNPQRTSRDPRKLRPYTRSNGSRILHSAVPDPAPSDQYDELTKLPVSILDFPANAGECNSRSRLHPTQKPIALFEYLVRTYSKPGDLVMDNAMGSGTAGLACVNTGRDFVGVERDEAYFAIAESRIAPAFERGGVA